MVVDLPAPFGPNSPVMLEGLAVSEASLTARLEPNDFDTLLTSIIAFLNYASDCRRTKQDDYQVSGIISRESAGHSMVGSIVNVWFVF